MADAEPRRAAAGGGALAPLALAGCGSRAPIDPRLRPARWVGAAHERGHRLRVSSARIGRRRTAAAPAASRVLIVGAGVAGLAAARALHAAAASTTCTCSSSRTAPAATAAATRSAAWPARWARTTCRCPAPDAHEVQDLLDELGLRAATVGRTVLRRAPPVPQPAGAAVHRRRTGTTACCRRPSAGSADAGAVPALRRSAWRRCSAVAAVRHAGAPGALARRRTPRSTRITFDAWLDARGAERPAACAGTWTTAAATTTAPALSTVSAWAGLHYFASRHGFHAPGDEADEPRTAC